MKRMIFLTIIGLSALSVFAQAPARQPIRQRLSIASRDFTITNFGAVGDGQVATDCSMVNGSPVLTCGGSRFVAEDIGKVVAVYGAGMLRNGYRQPLAATITSYLSASQITLSAAAQADVTNSERTVWGTNNTAAIQSAVNAAADAGGGLVSVPDGHYLTEGMYLDCSTIGNFPGYGYGQCIRTYNNISIKGGSALTTILENWNPDVATIGAVIDLGKGAEIPGFGVASWPPKRLANIEISNLTLRQVKYPTKPVKIISAYATEDVSIHDCYFYGYSYEGVYMGGGFKSIRWRVFNNVAYEIGKGGPAYGNTTSAYNLNGSYVEAFGNKASNCGQCFEAGARHAFFFQNVCENSTHSFNIGSTGSGIWDVTIQGNLLKNNYYALVAGNGNGTIHDIRFIGNTMIDTPDVNWSFGANTNTVVEVEADTVIHGQSIFSGNNFTFTTPAAHQNRSIFRIFQNPTFPNVSSDSITVADNTVTFASLPNSAYLIVGGLGGYKWEPNRTFALNAPAVGSMWGAYWYKALNAGTTGATEPDWPQRVGQTVQDGSISWLCMGQRPQVHFSGNRAVLPTNIPISNSLYSTWPGAIRIDYGVREMLKVENFLVNNMDWRMQVASPDMHEEIVPREGPYSDTRRYSKAYTDSEPVASFWSVGTFVQKRNISTDVSGWVVTRPGYAAPAYSPTAGYSAFGTLVRASTDNGRIYQLIMGNCVNAPEPVWPTDIGQTVTANGCTWKAVQNSARFTPLR